MIKGIGIDIVEVERIASAIERYGEKFLQRIFNETERAHCERSEKFKCQRYAARFAAKEAFSKAIGTGITDGFAFKLIGIINEENGKPQLQLFGIMQERWGQYTFNVSLSHTDSIATAIIVAEFN